jgi:gluconolactonase
VRRRIRAAKTGLSHYPNAQSVIWVYDVVDKKLRNPKVFASMEMNGKIGFADGRRRDGDGNVWAAMGWVGDGYDGVHVFSPDGTRIGMIRMPEIIGNLCFGGSKRNRLFMAGSTSLYAVYVETRGRTLT